MKLKRASLLSVFLLLMGTLLFAELTIWFKDGTSARAYKVVFQGQTAEIYLMDGNLRRVPVDQLDLKSSGIGKPEGTYGGTGTAPPKLPITTPPMPVNQAARQAQLKEEWERTEKTAYAQNDVGPIRKGDPVRIVSETQAAPSTGYYGIPQSRDDAYVVLYRNADGSYGKKLFDAVTFARNFKLEEKPKPVVSLPLEPRIPESEPVVKPETTPPPVVTSRPENKPETPLSVPRTSGASEEEQAPAFTMIIGAVLLTAIAVVAVLLTRKRKKAFLDSSKFKQYEEELRDFEIEIWLKHGKTLDQLVEICAKKFYGDQPGPMGVMTKMLKGVDRNALVAFIAKQGEMEPASAQMTYNGMKQRLDWIRGMIQEVAKRTGRMPVSESMAPTGIMTVPGKTPPAAPAPPTGIMPVPGPTTALAPGPPPTGIMPVPGSVPQPAPAASSPSVSPSMPRGTAAAPPRAADAPPPESASIPFPAVKRSEPDLPPYLGNVLRNLALLSSAPDKFES